MYRKCVSPHYVLIYAPPLSQSNTLKTKWRINTHCSFFIIHQAKKFYTGSDNSAKICIHWDFLLFKYQWHITPGFSDNRPTPSPQMQPELAAVGQAGMTDRQQQSKTNQGTTYTEDFWLVAARKQQEGQQAKGGAELGSVNPKDLFTWEPKGPPWNVSSFCCPSARAAWSHWEVRHKLALKRPVTKNSC